jgi:3-methylcrotonyl-CoA carboxylase alpha subunit
MRRRLFRHEQKTFPRVIHADQIYAAAIPGTTAPENFVRRRLDAIHRAGQVISGDSALQLGSENFAAHFNISGAAIELVVDGFYYRFSFARFKGTANDSVGRTELRSEIPGRIVKIMAHAGQVVEAGEPLLIQEAMKMEMTLKSPARTKIKELLVEEGAQVEADAVLLRFETAEG